MTLLRGGPLSGVSASNRAKQVRRYAAKIAAALAAPAELLRVLGQLAARLGRMRRQSKERRRPSTRQLRFRATLMT